MRSEGGGPAVPWRVLAAAPLFLLMSSAEGRRSRSWRTWPRATFGQTGGAGGSGGWRPSVPPTAPPRSSCRISPASPPQPLTSSLVRTPTPGPAPPHPPIPLPACWPPSFLTSSSVGPGRAQGYGPALAPPNPPRAASGPLWAEISPSRRHLGPQAHISWGRSQIQELVEKKMARKEVTLVPYLSWPQRRKAMSRLISWPFVLPGYAKTSLVGPGDAHLSSKGGAGPGHESSSPHPSGAVMPGHGAVGTGAQRRPGLDAAEGRGSQPPEKQTHRTGVQAQGTASQGWEARRRPLHPKKTPPPSARLKVKGLKGLNSVLYFRLWALPCAQGGQ